MELTRCVTCHRPIIKARSTQQNRSYWKLCVEPLSEYLEGYSREEIHEMLKFKFLSEVRFIKKRDGNMEEVRVMKSTSSLTTKEFNEFMEDIRIWASELGCWLGEPNEPPMEE